MNYGKAIRKIRRKNKKSQVQFSQNIGITQAYLSMIETNKALPSREVLELVAFNYKLTVAEVVIMATTKEDIPRAFYNKWEDAAIKIMKILQGTR
jgi:transcriptional regulator with XRE-family HTH domain